MMRIGKRAGGEDGLAATLQESGETRPKGQACVIAVTPSDGLKSKPLRELLAYWDRLRVGRLAPTRAELRPGDIPRALPHILLLDALDDAADFRIRLMGTHVVNGLGADLTGRNLSGLAETGDENPLMSLSRQAYENRAPAFLGYRRLSPAGRLVVLTEGVALPLSENERDVDRLVCGLSLVPRSNIGPLAAGAIER